jgi:ADP-heptose:LPS heptosyltransferase
MYKKILLYNSGGGLGDAIQLFPLILSLKNYFINSTFFYLGAHDNHFKSKLKEFNLRIESIDLDLRYFGFRWWHLIKVKQKIKEKNIEEFDLIIDLQSKIRNTLILKQLSSKHFFSSTFNFHFCTKKKKYLNKKNDVSANIISNLEIFLDAEIKKIDFNLDSLPNELINEAKKLLPESNYIGMSVTQGNAYRLKTWPIENFVELANKYMSIGKKIVFFIEKSETQLIHEIKKKLPNALFPENESKFSCPALVTALASRLEKAITIDNGVMHMLALADVPMISLFGPTSSKKFAPNISQNDILDSKFLYNSKDISKITIQDVLNLI